MDAEAFRSSGHQLIDYLADFLEKLPNTQIHAEQSPSVLRELIGESGAPLTGNGEEALIEAAQLLGSNAMTTSHPGFSAYIMGAASPLAALSDLLAGVISPPMTSYSTSALTVAMEAQTLRWVAEMVGYRPFGSGIFLSGGSIANFCSVRLAIFHALGPDVRINGVTSERAKRLRVYATHEAHSSIASAVEMAGLGNQAITWVKTTSDRCMDIVDLSRAIGRDRDQGLLPLMVIGIAGSTSIGAVDPLRKISELSRRESLWFHVDAAYGGFAAVSDEAPEELGYLCLADSLAVDPHKWMYMPADVGCLLTRHKGALFVSGQLTASSEQQTNWRAGLVR
jgi:glutamate/tyrosine decarboxylase-like PLP-dependent enzyme